MFHGGSRLLNLEKNRKKTQYSEFALNRSQKCPKTFWGDFFEINLCPVLHGGSSFWNFSKKMFSKFQKCPKSFPKNSKPVLNVFWGKFFEIFYAQCSMEGRVFENFRKKPKIFKIPKMPKIVPKKLQTCFERVLGQIFRNILCPVFHGGSSLRKLSKKLKNFSKFQKCPKAFPKVYKHILNVFWSKFWKKFRRSVPWRVESSKIFEKNVFKIPKLPKIVPKKLQTCFERVLGQIFRNILCPVLHGGSSFRNFSKKMFSKFQNCPKSFPKNSKPVLNVFWGKFFEIFYAQCSMEGRVFENFRKKPKIFNVPRKPKIVTKSIQTCFERVLG